MANDYTILSEVLHCTNGTSDKVYELELRSEGRGYVVRARYGRRGSVLKPLVKYNGSSEYEARRKYNELMAEKKGKGYKGVLSSLDAARQFLDIAEAHRSANIRVVPIPKAKGQKNTKAGSMKKKPKPAAPEKIDRNISFDL